MAAQQPARASPELRKALLSPRYRRNYTAPQSTTFLNCTAVAIFQSKNGLAVSASHDGCAFAINAHQVVFAMPPRIVEQWVFFNPKLTEPQSHALRKIPTWMAGKAKVMAIYDQPYWRETGFAGDVISPTGPLVEIHDAPNDPDGPFALFGFDGVPPQLRHNRRNEVIEAAHAQLCALFGEGAARQMPLFMQDWAENPLIATAHDHTSPQGHPSYGLPPSLNGHWND